jgi:hypothetical protein
MNDKSGSKEARNGELEEKGRYEFIRQININIQHG